MPSRASRAVWLDCACLSAWLAQAAAHSIRSPRPRCRGRMARTARGPLGTYNFAGDLGKAAFTTGGLSDVDNPAMAHGALDRGGNQRMRRTADPVVHAPPVRTDIVPQDSKNRSQATVTRKWAGGFGLLLAIGVLDSAPRMGFLLFLPFLMKAEGASLTTTGIALALVFIGGAAGKALCGWLGARLGLVATVVVTEVGTTAGILAVLALPLAPGLIAAAGCWE